MESLTIVIPAYNEEEAIGATIERCLAAKPMIAQAARLSNVELIVVSDGSNDRTAEIARSFEDVDVIVFPRNRGYGAAIKAGFAAGGGSIVGFLDADGTCDPRFFSVLCRALDDAGSEIALGSRLGPDSKMPSVRRLGNRIYAFLLGILCGEKVTDTASGMRVIRRSVLPDLYPLPDGLHFTPAMSARALLGGMRISELPMAYSERVGQSKLSVIKDGVRFLQAIIEGVLWYRPERLFLLTFTACFLMAVLWAAFPVEFYLRERRLEEWMIYRFIVCFLLGTSGFVAMAAGTLAHQFVLSGSERRVVPRFWPSLFEHCFCGKTFVLFMFGTVVGSLALIWSGVVEYVSTGHVSIHWSRVIVAAFGLLIAFISAVTATLLQVIKVRGKQRRLIERYDESLQAEDPVMNEPCTDDEQLDLRERSVREPESPRVPKFVAK